MSIDEADQNKYLALLEEEKKKVLSSVAREGVSLRENTGELSVVDNHPADTGSELFERSKDLALYDRHLKKIVEIDGAFERMARGTFGYCLFCGEAIPEQRLQVVPYASYCTGCQNLREKEGRERNGDDRPIEEELLATPFSRTFACQRGSDTCEGEDAWQDVEEYGNADSIQDRPEDNRR